MTETTTDPREAQVAKFRRAVEAAAGIYYRLDTGRSGGRNAAGTEATLRMHVQAAQAIERGAVDDESHPLWTLLDGNEKFAAKWQRIERRFYGCRT